MTEDLKPFSPEQSEDAMLMQAAVAKAQENRIAAHPAMAASLHLSQAVGIIRAMQFNEGMNRIARLQQLMNIKNNGMYKGALVQTPDGTIVECTTWKDFCLACGFSRGKLDEDIQNLAMYGADFLNISEKVGMGRNTMRELRSGINALPEEQKDAALDKLRTADDPSILKDLVEEFADRARQAKAQAAKEKAELLAARKKAEDDAKYIQGVLDKKAARVTQLEVDIDKLTSPDNAESLEAAKREKQLAEVVKLCGILQANALQLMRKYEELEAMPDSFKEEEVARANIADAMRALAEQMFNVVDLRRAFEEAENSQCPADLDEAVKHLPTYWQTTGKDNAADAIDISAFTAPQE